ncbi:MAG TPA: MerR family transcriptional regulator [Aggregatilinea sp.]|jgi:MerR family transcriptional regulator/heat shock protein HspR|uniref:heat shock protein transcriptional repressor HspR n=1 Tax=Aggregatilinea sp. TaxID=2806333 RepID=UPI002C2B095C|nr:MerR family transcriptional regulator [Aggregatilinea sp.]HML24783.1 MerR family transcriptional regulator [Aggregatilinea sp.]
MSDSISRDEPCYTIGIVARMVELHPQTLRNYEQMGLVVPQRSGGNIRLYSQREVDRLMKINRLTQELGVNLAGVEIILRLSDQIESLQDQLEALERKGSAAQSRH